MFTPISRGNEIDIRLFVKRYEKGEECKTQKQK